MAVNIGPKISVEGEAEYRKQMQNIVQQAKTLSSEMKVLTASFDANTSASKRAKETAALLEKQIKTQKEAISQIAGMVEKSAKAFGENSTETLKYQENLNKATAELYKLEGELQKTNSELNATKTSASGASSAFKKVKDSLYLLTSEGKTNKLAISAMEKAYDAAKAKTADLAREVAESAKEHGKHSEETGKLALELKEAREELDKLGKEIKESKEESKTFSTMLGNLGNKAKEVAKSGFSTLGNAIKTGLKGAAELGVSAVKGVTKTVAALGAAAGTAIVSLGKIGLEYNAEMEKYKTNFEVMLSSEEEAVAKVESLKKMAASTPFEMAGLADATQQLLAMGVASDDTEKYLKQLGDISLGSSDKFNSLVNAFGKMNSTGKVTLEYINMMAEQGFNPLNEISKQTGETMTQLYERLSKGNVTLDEVKRAMEQATSSGGRFEKGMEKASKTTQGMISTLKDNARALVGEVFQPISDGLKDKVLPGAINAIDRLTTAFREKGVNGMVEAAGDIIADTIGKFTSALPQFVDMAISIVKSFVTGIKNNQKQITDGAITTVKTLVSGITSMLPDLLVTGALLLGELIVGLLKEIPNLVASIPKIIDAIVSAFKANSETFSQMGRDIVSGIKNGIKAAWDGLVSWFNGIWNSLFSNRKVNVSVNKSETSSRAVDGSHASGLGYVPFDGYIARLHKGEMVLTKAQSEILRNAGYMYLPTNDTGGGQKAKTVAPVNHFGGQTFHIYQQPGESGEELAERIMEIMQTKVVQKGAALSG